MGQARRRHWAAGPGVGHSLRDARGAVVLGEHICADVRPERHRVHVWSGVAGRISFRPSVPFCAIIVLATTSRPAYATDLQRPERRAQHALPIAWPAADVCYTTHSDRRTTDYAPFCVFGAMLDGVNSHDQSDTIRNHRERLAMERLATFGQRRSRLIEAKRIQDRETAVALRDHAFDYCDRRQLFGTQMDLSTLERDVVTLEHAMVPGGGSMRSEIVRQDVDVAQGPIWYRLREV